jgi:hypothetical protein
MSSQIDPNDKDRSQDPRRVVPGASKQDQSQKSENDRSDGSASPQGTQEPDTGGKPQDKNRPHRPGKVSPEDDEQPNPDDGSRDERV